MRGVYSHVSPVMRADLIAVLQDRWQAALCQRAQFAPRSSIGVLDALLSSVTDQLSNAQGDMPTVGLECHLKGFESNPGSGKAQPLT